MMPEENPQQNAKTDDTGAEPKVAEMKVSLRGRLWWAILLVYLALFTATGYVAFFGRNVNPALDHTSDSFALSITDEASRAFIIDVLKDEAAEHKKKEALGQQSFNIVLGSLLGFLSAS
ncbi:MAG TPA: hypothetical protein VJT82_00410, partial [Pyrinomonadaceae bacterium]|nr:hypothetical protein [Pyrinomonadaceae bacterium]